MPDSVKPTDSESEPQQTLNVTPPADDGEPEEVTLPVGEPVTLTDIVSVDQFTAAHEPVMSAVEPHAIAAASRRLAAERGQSSEGEEVVPASSSVLPTSNTNSAIKGKTDDKGRTYDPSIHETPLRLNKLGYIACKRGGAAQKAGAAPTERRSFAAQPSSGQPGKQQPALVAVDPVALEQKAQALAVMGTGMFYTVGGVIFGDDMKPSEDDEGKQEVDGCVSTLKNYFIASGCPDVPPGIAVCVTFGMVLFKRYTTKPTFAQKIKGWGFKAYLWLTKKFT